MDVPIIVQMADMKAYPRYPRYPQAKYRKYRLDDSEKHDSFGVLEDKVFRETGISVLRMPLFYKLIFAIK